MNGYYSKRELAIGDPIFVKLYKRMFEHNHAADKCVAWCLMREYALKEDGKKDADLMMIFANEKGHGLGLELLNRIKQDYEIIRTQWDASTVQGREVCLKAGFVREDNLLTWRKDGTVQVGGAAAVYAHESGKGRDPEACGEGVGEGDPKQATA